jgi:predicted  nucleic acid-binding Zn-ribbon protein
VEAGSLADQARAALSDAVASAEAAQDVNVELQAHIDDVELRAAEATASAQAFKADADEARSIAETAQAEAAAALERAETATVETTVVEQGPAVPTSEGTEEQQRTVAELEDQLEQMSERLRHAYAQVESTQAAFSSARNTGEMPPVDAEVRTLSQEVERLRAQLGNVMAEGAKAEDRASRAEADLLATQQGVALDHARPTPGYEPPAEPSMRELDPGPSPEISDEATIEVTEDEEPSDEPKPELSLRSRLANTAARKKQRGRPNDDSASGF